MINFYKNIMGRLGNNLFQYAYLYAQARKGFIPSIYVQDEEYFKEYAGEIRHILGGDIDRIEYTAVHVRRGDYEGNSFYVDLSKDGYYERAMALVPGPYIVFSDDIEWCKQQEIFKGCDFAGNSSPEEALNFMASCTNHVIANSSFSWWGAYLSPHGGKVIAPKKWYTDEVERTKIPDSWTRV